MASPSRTKATPDRVAIAERERQALELRKAGATYERIAQALGLSERGGAWKLVHRALEQTLQEPSDELRRLESERLDALLRALWPAAMDGKGYAVERCLQIMDRRAKMLGLDAPSRSSVTVVTEDVVDAEIRRLEAELARTDGSHRSTAGEAPTAG